MVALRIRHRTTYTYRRPVSLGPHRLMLRPRESRDLRLISSEINVTPAGVLTWAQDVFGNSVATVSFSAMTDVLAIDAATELELHASAWPVFDIAANRGVGGFNLIPVGVARDIRQVMPVVGSFVGDSYAFQAMSVEVAVTANASANLARLAHERAPSARNSQA